MRGAPRGKCGAILGVAGGGAVPAGAAQAAHPRQGPAAVEDHQEVIPWSH